MAGVPDWKKAIFDRRKKAEDEEKKKHDEEEAYLATLPPWKRALVQKRERERQQLEREKAEAVSSGAAVERNNSFQNTQQQKSVSSHPTQGWNRRVTPPSSKGRDRPTSPTSPSSSGHFFSSADASSQQKQSRELNRRRSSVTALPGVDEQIASKIAAQSYTSTTTAKNEPVGVTLHGPHRQRSASESKKVVSSVKKLNVQSSQQTSEMPAWKKALLERKKGRAPGGVGGSKPPQKPTSIDSQSLSMTRTDSPPEGSVNSDGSQNDMTSAPPPLRRTPSPSENSYNTKPATLGLQRMPSPPVEGEDRASTSNSGGHSDRKSLGLARTPSPVETLGAKFEQMQKKKPSESVGAVSASERKPASGVASGAAEARGKSSKSVPARSAPVAPSAASSSSSSSKRMPTSHPKPQHSKQQTSTAGGVRMQPRPTPEVVNRGGNKESTTIQQSEAIRSEGVKHRAPVYKEVLTEWADVSEEDKKFRNLPPWKQALIRRRRADIAKRMGHTTSVDDVSLTNSQVPIEQEKKPDIPSGNRTAGAPSWKKQAPKPEETMKYSIAEKKQTSSRMEQSSNSNVKALLGRFSKPAPAPPPSTAVPKVTVSRSSRSPSPSSVPSTSSTTSSSHPQPSTTTTTTASTAAPTRSGTKKSFTWTPGEDTMPGEALSDDSSEEEDDEEGEGEYTVTNLDDTSDDEEEEEVGGEEDGGGVVLLQPPKIFASTSSSSTPSIAPTTRVEEDSSKKVRKTSSILAPINRSKRKPLRRVAFSETDLTVEHYYPKYDYSDYEEIQNDAVSTGFSFSFWKSRETVEATDSADKQNGLSQRLHPSLRSPESDPDNYRYSPSRESTQPGHTPPISSVKTSTVTLSTYKPSILSGYGTDESLQQSYMNALENGTRDEGEGDEEMEVEGEDVADGSDHLMPSDGVPNFYASLSSDDAAMLW